MTSLRGLRFRMTARGSCSPFRSSSAYLDREVETIWITSDSFESGETRSNRQNALPPPPPLFFIYLRHVISTSITNSIGYGQIYGKERANQLLENRADSCLYSPIIAAYKPAKPPPA